MGEKFSDQKNLRFSDLKPREPAQPNNAKIAETFEEPDTRVECPRCGCWVHGHYEARRQHVRECLNGSGGGDSGPTDFD